MMTVAEHVTVPRVAKLILLIEDRTQFLTLGSTRVVILALLPASPLRVGVGMNPGV